MCFRDVLSATSPLEDFMAIVQDIMTTSVITVPHHAEVDVAIELILSKRVSALAVVDSHGTLLGVLSEFDLLELCGKLAESGAVMHPCSEYMTTRVKTVSPHASIEVVANIFKAASIRRLFVIDGDKLVGVISRRDLLRYIRQHRHASHTACVANA
jgi:CBS domain-containing protein